MIRKFGTRFGGSRKRPARDGEKTGVLRSRYFMSLLLSVFLVSIFVLSLITAVIYNQFLAGIKNEILTENRNAVAEVEKTMSAKMLDIKAMAYAVSRNPAFTYFPLGEDSPVSSDTDIVRQLQTYISGNSFFADIIFYRDSEPDTVYSSLGRFTPEEAQRYLFTVPAIDFNRKDSVSRIFRGVARVQEHYGEPVYAFEESLAPGTIYTGKTVWLYVYKKTFDALISPYFHGQPHEVAVLDEAGKEIYATGNFELSREILSNLAKGEGEEPRSTSADGIHYFWTESPYNGWTYVAALDEAALFTAYYQKVNRIVWVLTAAVAAVLLLSVAAAVLNYSPVRRIFAKISEHFSDLSPEHFTRNELEYIERLVDVMAEARIEIRQGAVLSNLLWGQYNDEESAAGDCEEAALSFADEAFAVIVLSKSAETHESDVRALKQLLHSRNVLAYSVNLLSPEHDAVVANFNPYEHTAADLRQIIESRLDIFGPDVVFSVGDAVDSLPDLEKSFSHAKSAFACLGEGRRAVCYDECAGVRQPVEISRHKKEILGALRRGEAEVAAKAVEKLLDSVDNGDVNDEKFKYVHYNLLALMTDEVKHMEAEPEAEYYRLTDELMSAALTPKDVRRLMARLAQVICEAVNRTKEKEDDNALLEKIFEIIEARLCDPLMSLEVLADECGVSTSYLGRYFKNKTGHTPMKYMDIRKMELAKKLLRETDLSLNEIVTKSGYIDASNFIRKFKKEVGITPINYRKNNQTPANVGSGFEGNMQ